MTPIFPNRDSWSSAIGNFIINFGVLDYLVFEFLETRLSVDRFASMKSQSFQARISWIKQYIANQNHPTVEQECFEEFFTRLDPIRELRNHIAHGHLLVRFDEANKSYLMTLSLPKNLDAAYSSESRHLDFSELKKALDELSYLIEEFNRLSSHWHGKVPTS